MAITITNLTVSAQSSPSDPQTTASITTTRGRLVLIAVRVVVGAAQTTVIPTISGGGVTSWTQEATIVDSSLRRRHTLFSGVPSTSNTGVISIGNLTNVVFMDWIVDEAVNGNTVVQSGSNQVEGTNTTLTVTLSAFEDANNLTYGALGHSADPGNITPGSGFTEIVDNNVSAGRRQSQYKSTSDTTVDWSWASTATIAQGLAAEVSFIAPAAGNPLMFSPSQVAVG